VLALLSAFSIGAVLAAGPVPEPCRLLSQAEVAKVQETSFKEARATRHETGGVAISQCFYPAEPFSKSVSLEIVTAPKAEAVLARWKKMFHEKREDDEEEESRGASGPERVKRETEVPVAGLGDEAFWVPSPATGALHVLADGVSFRVSLGGAGNGDAKLARCRALAEKLLARLRPAS